MPVAVWGIGKNDTEFLYSNVKDPIEESLTYVFYANTSKIVEKIAGKNAEISEIQVCILREEPVERELLRARAQKTIDKIGKMEILVNPDKAKILKSWKEIEEGKVFSILVDEVAYIPLYRFFLDEAPKELKNYGIDKLQIVLYPGKPGDEKSGFITTTMDKDTQNTIKKLSKNYEKILRGENLKRENVVEGLVRWYANKEKIDEDILDLLTTGYSALELLGIENENVAILVKGTTEGKNFKLLIYMKELGKIRRDLVKENNVRKIRESNEDFGVYIGYLFLE